MEKGRVAADEERIAEILAAWQESLERGEIRAPEDLAAEHPDLGDRLVEVLATLPLLDSALGEPPIPTGESVGPYRIEAELGAGGMGRVYRAVAREPGLLPVGTPVALKFVHPHLVRSPDVLGRLRREAEAGARVDHPNVVRTFEIATWQPDGVSQEYLVMEFVEGESLRGILHEHGTLAEDLCRHVAVAIADGLAALHAEGVVHRDLKPENVVVTTAETVKIMDLGLAALAGNDLRLSLPGGFLGSIWYAAPERFAPGGTDDDGRSDLYSLGAILYELSTGRQPFADDDARVAVCRVLEHIPAPVNELEPELSPFFAEVVRTLLEKRPERRFGSAAELRDVLRAGAGSRWWRDRSTRGAGREAARPRRAERRTALFGREEEMRTLLHQYESAKAGRGAVVLVEGEEGIGKTRLVEEFLDALEDRGEEAHLLHGATPPGGAATASGAFTDALGHRLADDGPATTEPSADSIARALQATAHERPTVLVVEDLHLAPPEGREIFLAAARAVSGHRVLLMGTTRPGIDAAWTSDIERLPRTERLVLHRLGPKDLFRLLAEEFGSRPLAERLAARIAEKSDGNPFLVFEILRQLLESGRLVRRQDGTCESSGRIHEIAIPSSARESLLSRIAALGEEEREALEVASCAGDRFEADLVAEVLSAGPVDVLRRLARLEAGPRLVRRDGRYFRFDHQQVREAVYGSIHEQLREEYHLALGRALADGSPSDEEPPSPDGPRAVRVCRHLLHAGRDGEALRWLDAALAHLDAEGRKREAVELSLLTLRSPDTFPDRDRARFLLRTADRLARAGRGEEQEELLRDARRIAESVEDAALARRALAALGACHHTLGRNEEAGDELRRALDAARAAQDPEVEASARAALASLALGAGRPEEAREHGERRVEIARELGDRVEEAQAEGALGVVAVHLGRLGEAERHHLRRFELCREIGDDEGAAIASVNLGVVWAHQARYEEARRSYERGLEAANRIGNRGMAAKITGNLGAIHFVEGRYETARECFEGRLAISAEIGDRRGEALATLNLAAVDVARGRYEKSLRAAERGRALAVEVGDRPLEAAALGARAGSLLELGRIEAALAGNRRHLDLTQEIRDRAGETNALLNGGRLNLLIGAVGDAVEGLDEAIRLARESGARNEEGIGLSLRAFADACACRWEEAARRAEEATRILRETGAVGELEVALVTRGRILVAAGREEEAQAPLLEVAEGRSDTPVPAPAVLALCELAAIERDRAPEAVRRLLDLEDRIGVPERMTARYGLFRATGDAEHLEAAHELLEDLIEAAPEESRNAMRENVPLHREIQDAFIDETTR